MKDTTGLSIGYRLIWRLQYIALFFLGPAQRPAHQDPRRLLRKERAQKVLDAHAARGTEADQTVHDEAAGRF